MTVVELVPATATRATTESSLELAAPAYELAQKIARTDFVPAALRGKPEAVLAAILTGHELGIPPMQSLQKIHVIEGRPALSAELMRAMVLAAGHELWIEESNSTRCTVKAKRTGSAREQSFTWTMDDAKRAGLDGRKNWRSFPADMLVARATGRAVRAVFPDVVAGLGYTVEELQDGFDLEPPAGGDGDDAAGKKPPGRRRARRAATTAPAPAPAAVTQGAQEFPPLPDEELVVPGPLPGGGESVVPLPEADSPPTSPSTSGGGGEADADTTATATPPDDDGPARPLHLHVLLAIKDLEPAGLDAKASDAFRHAWLKAFSGGAYESSKSMPISEAGRFGQTVEAFKEGEIELGTDEDGWWLDAFVSPRAAVEETDQPSLGLIDSDWWLHQLAPVPGVGPARLLRHARDIAPNLGCTVPNSLDELDDARLVAACQRWLAEQAS